MPEEQLTTATILKQFGGWKGLLDSSLPATVFIVVRFFASINASIGAAVGAGLVVVGLRFARGEALQQAMSGFVGLIIAVVIVRTTGTGKNIFIPGILLTAGTGVGFLVSLLARRPIVALGLVAIDEKYGVWKTYAPLRRACTRSTAVWCVSFFVRATVATGVYLFYGDKPGDNLAMYVVINVVKWVLILGAALFTVEEVKRAGLPATETA